MLAWCVQSFFFKGFLRDESDVFVTMTGGCPFSNSFEVSELFLHSYQHF
jgi:hypothetical protein